MNGPLRRGIDRLASRLGVGEGWEQMEALVAPDLASGEGLQQLLDLDDPIELGSELRLPRIRPMLLVMAARAVGAAKVDEELQYAVEALHLALIAHDVALGERGSWRRRTLRKLFSVSTGVLHGNLLTVRAMELSRHVKAQAVMSELVDTLREMAEAQVLCAEVQQGAPVDMTRWAEHAEAHTGAVFAFCCRAGALVGRAGPGHVAALGRFGRGAGRMWHIAEDLAGLTGPGGGEYLLARVVSGRPMLPLALVWDEVQSELLLLLDDPTEENAEILLAAMEREGGMGQARQTLVEESWTARRSLERLPETGYRRGLERFLTSLAGAGSRRS